MNNNSVFKESIEFDTDAALCLLSQFLKGEIKITRSLLFNKHQYVYYDVSSRSILNEKDKLLEGQNNFILNWISKKQDWKIYDESSLTVDDLIEQVAIYSIEQNFKKIKKSLSKLINRVIEKNNCNCNKQLNQEELDEMLKENN